MPFSQNSRVMLENHMVVYNGLRLSGSCTNVIVAVPLNSGAGGSVATGAGGSVAAGSTGSVAAAGASVATAPPQAASSMLARTTSESRIFKLRFMFLLQENRM